MSALPPDVLPPFPGLTDEAMDFLSELRKNNDRDWFKPRKDVYDDQLLMPMRMLAADLSRQLPARGIPLSADPRRAVFRIYRDTRFSKNKAPYKTHVALTLHRGDSKASPGALYVHVEPGKTRIGGGFWRPDKDFLRHWRERLVSDPDRFLQVIEDVEAAGLELETPGSKLTRMPRGFNDHRDSPAAEYLQWKGGFVAFREDLPNDAVTTPAFTDTIIETAEALRPLLEYGWAIVDETTV